MELLSQLGGAGLVGRHRFVEPAVRQDGTECGKFGACGRPERSHAHDAEGDAEILGEELAEDGDIGVGFDEGDDLDDARVPGGFKGEVVQGAQRRRFDEVVGGDNQGLAQFAGGDGQFRHEPALQFDINGGEMFQRGGEHHEAIFIGSFPLATLGGETEGEQHRQTLHFHAFTLADPVRRLRADFVESDFDDVASRDGGTTVLSQGVGLGDGADDEGRGGEVKLHGAGA